MKSMRSYNKLRSSRILLLRLLVASALPYRLLFRFLLLLLFIATVPLLLFLVLLLLDRLCSNDMLNAVILTSIGLPGTITWLRGRRTSARGVCPSNRLALFIIAHATDHKGVFTRFCIFLRWSIRYEGVIDAASKSTLL